MHPNTKLSFHTWCRIARSVETGQASASELARLHGVSKQVVSVRLKRYRTEGLEGLHDRSSRPHHSPRRLTSEQEEEILADRRATKEGPKGIALRLGRCPSTVYLVLKRNGVNRKPRPPKPPVRRYEHEAPGDLMHVDFKELAGIGGGKRFQFSMVDDHSREAYAEILNRATVIAASEAFERGRLYFQSHGVRIKRVLTDNGMQFTMAHTPHPQRRTKFERLLANHGIKHRRTRVYSPQTNGKVERFHRTVDEQLYNVFHFDSEAHRAQALTAFLRRYNTQRRHQGIGGLTPVQRRERFFQPMESQECA